MTVDGTAVRAIRIGQKMGLRELARRTGRNRAYLSRLERGQRGAGGETRRLIAKALEVPPDAITRKEQP